MRGKRNKVSGLLTFYLFISLIAPNVFGAEYEISDLYNTAEDMFSSFEDPNAGLTMFPTLMIPTGGRLEGMGTAYTALSCDTGCLESNPAGSSSLLFPELALSSHPWIADSTIMGIGFASRTGELGYGAGAKFLNVPFTEYNSFGEKIQSGYFTESIATLNLSYNLFRNRSFGGLALGTNLKAAYRTLPGDLNPETGALAGALMADFGLLTGFNFLKTFESDLPNFSLGASLRNLGVSTLPYPLPLQFSAGAAYRIFSPMTLSFDFNLPLSLDPLNYPAKRWDMAAGLELSFTKFLSLQSGFRLGANPRVSLGFTAELEKLFLVANYNIDLSGSLNPLDKFSIQARIKLDSPYSTAHYKAAPVIRISSPKPLKPTTPESTTLTPEQAPPMLQTKGPVAAPETAPEKEETQEPDEYVLKNVRFNQEENSLTDGSFQELDEFIEEMKRREDITILITAYSEFEGNPLKEFDNYTQRAMNLKEYLKKNGIGEERVKVSTTGNLSQDEEGKKILMKVIPKDKSQLNKLKEELKSRLRSFDAAPSAGEPVMSEEIEVSGLNGEELQIARLVNSRKGDIITFPTILFEENRSTLQPAALSTVDKLASVMNYEPEMEILISTYARFRGNIIEEMDLCVSRAYTLKENLIAQGIEANRIKISHTGNIVRDESDFKVEIKVIEKEKE